MPEIAKILQCKQEKGNLEDFYTVSIMKVDTIIGHDPHENSHVMWYFIENVVVVTYQVSDQRKHSKILEIPCIYIFSLYALN